MFFFVKKNQKTFAPWHTRQETPAHEQKFFASFFQEIRLPLLFTLAALASCAGSTPRTCAPAGTDMIYVVSRGWHTEIGIPADRLDGPLGIFRQLFPGAQAVMFGYGKRTFMTAPADTISEYVLGPVPGPAVIEVFGLRVMPPQAYGTQDMVALPLPRSGARALSAFLWDDLARDHTGAPLLVAPGFFPGSRFYAARSRYSLGHTCNTWVAAALHAAGIPVDPDGVVFSGQTMARAADAAAAQCDVATPAGRGSQ
jgi:hypothetical protein